MNQVINSMFVHTCFILDICKYFPLIKIKAVKTYDSVRSLFVRSKHALKSCLIAQVIPGQSKMLDYGSGYVLLRRPRPH